MGILQAIKDIVSSPESSFKKLLSPDYFSNQRKKFLTPEEYAKWLRMAYAQYASLAHVEMSQGKNIPKKWIDGIVRIEEEIGKMKSEGYSHIFPANEEKVSEKFRNN